MEDLKDHIETKLGDAVNAAIIANGELTIEARRAEIMTVISFLRDDPICKFSSLIDICLLYTSPSPRDRQKSRMPSSA